MIISNLLLTLTNTLAFIILGSIFWLLPGYYFLRTKEKINKFERFFLGLTLGFATYAAVIFVARLIGLPFWVGYLPFIVLTLKQIKNMNFRQILNIPIFSKQQKIFITIALAGALIQSLVLIRSGRFTINGLQFTDFSFHDSIWHFYLINELKDNFPPRHPGFAPIIIKNYHFLFDLTISSLAKYLPFSMFELYYRVVPIFVSLLFSASVFVFSLRLFKSEKIANIAVFLTLFSGNASWFVNFFRGDEFQFSSNTFMLDSITFLLLNPHAVIVFPLMFAGIIGIMQLENKFNYKWMVLSAITFGVMIGIKAWGGLLVLSSLPIAAMWMSLKKRNHHLWLVWVGSVVISLVIFLPIYDSKSAAGLIFTPGWLLKRMVEDPDRYNMPKYFLLEQHYRATNNVLRLIQINLTQVVIYLFGNLWIRVLGFITLFSLFRKKISASLLFTIPIILGSLTLPILFNQGRMSYDIVQFGPYALVLLSIFTAPAIYKLSTRFPKLWQTVIILVLLIISTPSNSKHLSDWIDEKILIVSNNRLAAYKFFRENTDPNSVILIFPRQEDIRSAKVAALSQRTTYLSAKTNVVIQGEKHEPREKKSNDFFNKYNKEQRNEFINSGAFDYLFISKDSKYQFYPSGLNLREVFSNESVIIYQVI